MLSVNNIQSTNYQINNKTTFKQYNYYSNRSKTEKLGIGLASFIVPGLGQVINKETSKGIAMFIADIATLVTFYSMKQSSKKYLFIPWLANLGIKCWAARDAYKHA